MPDFRGSDPPPGAPRQKGNPPPRPGGEPEGRPPARSEQQIEQLLDVYTQLFQAANRDQAQQPAAMGGSHNRSPRGAEPPPVPKAPVAPESLAQSGLSLMQVC